MRVHRDTEVAVLARDFQARAFTTGQDGFFGAGEYDPATPSGFGVLTHEPAHTLQQGSGSVAARVVGPDLAVSEPGDRDEQVAEAAARRVTAPVAVQRSGASGAALTVQRDAATARRCRCPRWPGPGPSRSGPTRACGCSRWRPTTRWPTGPSPRTGPSSSTSLKRWGAAWDRHNTVLVRGGEQAAKENFIEGLVVDVVASALVAAAGAALFPAVAAAELWSGAWFAFNAGASVASRVGGSFGADTIARPNETGLAGFDGEIDAKLAAMSQFGQSADAFQVPDAGALEKEIWYAWISQLSDDEVPDQDEIQHHLVSLGIIPDYFYMTDEDQHRAVAEARQHMAAAPRQAHPPADQ